MLTARTTKPSPNACPSMLLPIPIYLTTKHMPFLITYLDGLRLDRIVDGAGLELLPCQGITYQGDPKSQGD